ncbi:unnamed protein product [Rhizoctonia solani]|uniref:Uncharacterized protein n=1 Tax=Rhizoctonia solani TaxID=456999 RepID=A0A8H3AZ05_9AGAM|nr:unnamed protein product [Rhizoctonia solani]
MDLDTNWCPVCDRLIAPERTTHVDSDCPPEPTKTIKPPKRKTTAHSRQGSRSKPTGIDLMTTSKNESSSKSRTVISQTPSALYCSVKCREKDQRSSEKFKWSLETMYSAGGSAGPASPLFVSGSESEGWAERRLSAGTTTSSSGDENNDKAALYAGYPLTFHRREDERSRKGSWASLKDLGGVGTPRNSPSIPQSDFMEPHTSQNASMPSQPIHNVQTTDSTPTQSLYSISAQGLLVRPAMLRAKTDFAALSPLDDAPRLYHPSSVPMSRSSSGTRHPSLPSSSRLPPAPSAPNSPTYRKPIPSQSHIRRRSEVLSHSALSEANRTKSSESIKPKAFMPLYPALVIPPAPQTRTVRKWVVESERLVEKDIEEVQEEGGERKLMFTFNTRVK